MLQSSLTDQSAVVFTHGAPEDISTAIYTAVHSGDRATAYKWTGIIIVISFSAMIMLNYWSNYQKKIISRCAKK